MYPKTRLTPSLHFSNWVLGSLIFYGGFCCRGISVFCRGISLFLLEHTFCVLSKTRLTSRLQLFQLIFEDTFVRECTVRLGKSWFRVVQVVHWGTTFEGRGGLGPPPPHPPPSACLLFIGFQNHCSTKILFSAFKINVCSGIFLPKKTCFQNSSQQNQTNVGPFSLSLHLDLLIALRSRQRSGT